MWLSMSSNDKLWCYGESNKSFNSQSSPLFTCKISRLGNYKKPELSAIFKGYSNWEIAFVVSLSVTLLCTYDVLQRCFSSYWWSRATRICAYAKHFHLDVSTHYLLLLRQKGQSYRCALFGSLHSCIDSGLFYRELNKFRNSQCFFLHHTNHTIYLEEIKTKYR